MEGIDLRPLAASVFRDEELAQYESAGYGQSANPGSRPALLIVDVTYAFTGINGPDADYPLASGESAWAAVAHLEPLIAAARAGQAPVIYSRNSRRPTKAEKGGWSAKIVQRPEPPRAHDVVDELAPQDGDLVITKAKPSAFFATPLASWLIELEIDTLLIGGGTTSGCLRATVVDAFSYNFTSFIPQQATFDRSETSQTVNIVELSQKYATVVDTEDAVRYLATVAEDRGGSG